MELFPSSGFSRRSSFHLNSDPPLSRRTFPGGHLGGNNRLGMDRSFCSARDMRHLTSRDFWKFDLGSLRYLSSCDSSAFGVFHPPLCPQGVFRVCGGHWVWHAAFYTRAPLAPHQLQASHHGSAIGVHGGGYPGAVAFSLAKWGVESAQHHFVLRWGGPVSVCRCLRLWSPPSTLPFPTDEPYKVKFVFYDLYRAINDVDFT